MRAAPDTLLAMLLQLWASLHSAHRVYWTLHWRAKGQPFYGDHLLYQRLYEARVKEIDRVAETIAALYGSDHLQAPAAVAAEARIVNATVKAANPGIRAAEYVLQSTNAVNAALGSHPYGIAVNNVVAGIADSALEALYLLQQRSR